MQTAISVPDETFERVARRARELGLSRSEFFARAAERFLEHLDEETLIAEINAAVDLAGPGENSNEDAARLGRKHLESDQADW